MSLVEINVGRNQTIINKKYTRTQLSMSQQRRIKRLERDLGKKLTLLWEFTNRHGERFIFGRFGLKKDKDNTIATIAGWNNRLHKFLVSY